jgi:MATE family multidrug resistance protein
LFELTIDVNSVRVSNELGAGNARTAKFAVVVVSITSIAIGVVCMAVVYATRDYFPYLFTSSEAVAEETTKLAVLLGITVLLNSLQPVLSGKYKKNIILDPEKDILVVLVHI